MLAFQLSRPFGQAKSPPQPQSSLLQTLARLQQREIQNAAKRVRAKHRAGLGALGTTADYDDFLAKVDRQYNDGVVTCSYDQINRAFCRLVSEPTAAARRTGSIAALQRATDRLLNLIPIYQLAGQPITIRTPSGGTINDTLPAYPKDPIATLGGGYDGVEGAGTQQFANVAMILAAMLKQPPPDVVPAFGSTTPMPFAKHSAAIADYFNNVADNFPELLADYKARGEKPEATMLVPESAGIIMQPYEEEGKGNTVAWIIVGTLAAVGVVGISAAAIKARKKRRVAALAPA